MSVLSTSAMFFRGEVIFYPFDCRGGFNSQAPWTVSEALLRRNSTDKWIYQLH